MNSIEQFWKSKNTNPEQKPIQFELADAPEEIYRIPVNQLRASKEQLKEKIWKLLIEEREFLSSVASMIDYEISDNLDCECVHIISSHVKVGFKVVTTNGELDTFDMLENLDRIKNWHRAIVRGGTHSFTFPQSPIMREILFNSEFGLNCLNTIEEDVEDLQICNLVKSYLET